MPAETIEHHQRAAAVTAAGDNDFPSGNPADSWPAQTKTRCLANSLSGLADPFPVPVGAMSFGMSPIPAVIAIAAPVMTIIRFLNLRNLMVPAIFRSCTRGGKSRRSGDDKRGGYHSGEWILHHIDLRFICQACTHSGLGWLQGAEDHIAIE